MSNTPKIRFSGFTEDWEQRKLGDLVDRVTRKNQDLVSELPLTISAQYGLIDQNEFFDKRVASKDVSGYYLIENGEFAYNKSTSTDAPWGAIKRLDRYENGVLSTLYIIFGIKENNPVDSDFLVSYYSTNLWHKGIHEIAAEGARNHGLLNIAPADFFETKLMIPQDIEEQKKIGKYFEELERLITLHQRKYDDTKLLKKYMLQKMFPQNGQKVPEIRFSGFTGDWEQRKLGDVTESIKNGYTYKADGSREHLYKITRIESISSGAINIEKLGSSDNVNENYKLEDGDILFSHINSLPYIANTAIYTSNLGEIYHGMNLLNIRAKHEIIDSHFLLHLLKKESSRNWFRIIAKPAVNQASISTTEVSSFVFMMPNMEEQKRISSVLDNIDNLLTLHQRKCDELKELKKYMLQNMFPQKG